MKALLILAATFTLSGNCAFAQNGDFAKNKEQSLKMIDERIKNLQSHRNCVANANDLEAFKKCHETMRNARETMKNEFLQKRRQHIEQRMKKSEVKKENE